MASAPPLPAVDERTVAAARAAHELPVQRFVQPDDVTCGPTCLRKVYSFYGLDVGLDEVIASLERNEDGGTLAVFLGISALKRGLRARIYSYDLRIFDPTWARLPHAQLAEKIHARFPYLNDAKRLRAAQAYLHFLELGGDLAFEELTPALLKSIIDREHPILAGLSATYLYRYARERWDPMINRLVDDDVRGEPTGHFVVISGYEQWGRRLIVLDPFEQIPPEPGDEEKLVVDADRLTNAILLGDVTYDAVLLEVWPAEEPRA
ncbi:hypothetical protein [Longimicrobium sp.]|uniref:hypothetical protein n=1 Tax=Longimicrobium sp. TaxID=2029185 RepID=UPI002C522886|nr:hypothetical protein [Longimicrobium sp.]HSU17841.1 hypothetical protein [Longimicrobium sp.]